MVLIVTAVLLTVLALMVQLFLCTHLKRWYCRLIPLLFPIVLFFAGLSAYRPVSPYGCGLGQMVWIILLGTGCVSLLLGFGLGWLVYWWRGKEEDRSG